MKQTIRRGTTQASMRDGLQYIIEMWNGRQWDVVDAGPYKSKREADTQGFAAWPDHRK